MRLEREMLDMRERIAQQVESNDRSQNLLRRYLTDEQWHSLKTNYVFCVTGSDGHRYYIRSSTVSNVIQELEYEQGRWYRIMCGVLPCENAEPRPPLWDHLLAQMLTLTTDAPSFLLHAVVGPPTRECPPVQAFLP